jgi:molecular chaperone Hsp33
MSDAESATEDFVQRFVVEGQAVRGQFVRLDASWGALREHAEYPEPVRELLGEAMAAAVLLASTLKFEGGLTLELKSDAAVRLLVAQCTHDFRIRGVARFDAAKVAPDFAALAGGGYMTVTIDADEAGGRQAGGRYQGIVALEGGSMSASLEHYFANSEQLPTSLRLVSDEHGASGLLIQRLPGEGGVAAPAAAQQTWEHAHAALLALEPAVLLRAAPEQLLRECFTGQDLRVFRAQPVEFRCRCDLRRVQGILRSLGEADVRELLAEQGAVTVTCEFCGKPYRFDGIDVEQLFATGAVPGSERVN